MPIGGSLRVKWQSFCMVLLGIVPIWQPSKIMVKLVRIKSTHLYLCLVKICAHQFLILKIWFFKINSQTFIFLWNVTSMLIICFSLKSIVNMYGFIYLLYLQTQRTIRRQEKSVKGCVREGEIGILNLIIVCYKFCLN